MMICPETFYEHELKGKTSAQIMTTIRGLKQEIGRLKNIVEHPDHQCTMHPSEGVRISCLRDYLERAKQALVEAGGNYTPSAAEQKAMAFDANIRHINKVVFSIGGCFNGYATRTYTIDGDNVHSDTEYSLSPKHSDMDNAAIEGMNKGYFFKALESLHIGEWRKNYTPRRFGIEILDGTQWTLEIYFSKNVKPAKIYGDNAYPYNFDRLLDLFEIGGER